MSNSSTHSNVSQCVILCGGADEPDIHQLADITTQYNTSVFIGVDRGSLTLIQHGYPLDYAIGDFDSVTGEEIALIAANTEVLQKHPSDKDDTDMELGLLLAQKIAPSADFYILGGIGKQRGRLDHLIANIWLVFQPRFKNLISRLQFVEANLRIQFFTAGNYTLQAVYQDQFVSVISLTAIKQLEIMGAKYELQAVDIKYPRALISNEFYPSQPIHLSFKEGLIMILHVQEEKEL